MPRYRAKTMLFVDGARIRPGQEFNSEAPPTDQWEPVEDAKPASKAAAAPAKAPTAAKPGSKTLDEFSDEELRDFIQTKTKNRPSEQALRENLLAKAKQLAKPDGN